MTSLPLDQLRLEIRGMTARHALYRVLRDELRARGYWRARRRGNPAKAYQRMQAALLSAGPLPEALPWEDVRREAQLGDS